MSGIITGPYFKTYFDASDLQLGTMVAILEVGAFSEHNVLRPSLDRGVLR